MLIKIAKRPLSTRFKVLNQTLFVATIQLNDSTYTVSPLVIDYLKQADIDLSKILGSGDKGKITIHDVKRHDKPRVFKQWSEIILEDIKLKLDHFRSSIKSLVEPGKEQDIVENDVVKYEESMPMDDKRAYLELSDKNGIQNPKHDIPHYTLMRSVNVTQTIEFVKQINSKYPDVKLNLSDLIIKAVHLASLDNSTLYQYYMNDRMYKTDVLFINYVNHFDQSKNRIIRLDHAKSLKMYQRSNYEPKDAVSLFTIEDCASYPVTEVKPIITANNVR